jgi:hypothetical protein
MNTKEYQHYHCLHSYTVICKVPPKEAFFEHIKKQQEALAPLPMTIEVGLAKLHPEDQFCYKTGREIARNNIRTRQYVMESVMYRDGAIYVILASEQEDVQYLMFSISQKRKTPYLDTAYAD